MSSHAPDNPARPPKPQKREPERMCVLTRTRGTAETLIRFVKAPDGTIVPDLKGDLPGRGAWVTADRISVALAVKKGLLARALDADKAAADGLPDRVDALMEQRLMGSFGLLRRAGQMVLGAAKVEAEVRKGAAVFVLHAREASADGVHKITKARRAVRFEDGPSIPAINCFGTEQLGLALGAENVIHAAAIGNRQAMATFGRAVALLRYRGLWPETGEPDEPVGGAETGTTTDERTRRPQEDGTQ